MTQVENDPQEADVPEKAVAALNSASQKAERLGFTRVLVCGDDLVRITGTERTILKKVPGRKKVGHINKPLES